MTLEQNGAPIIILHPDAGESGRIADWLRTAGLGAISAARTSDEAIFVLGNRCAKLLIIDECVTERSERRLLQHIAGGRHAASPALVRLVSDKCSSPAAAGRPPATGLIRKPLVDHDVVTRIGVAIRQPDLVTQFRRAHDLSRDHLEAAQQMQIRLLPTAEQLQAVQAECGVGLAALYDPGEALGGDFWGIWPVGQGRFALAIADFAGHGLGAALNTFRIHALLSEKTLPRDQPEQMTTLLNERLHALLPRGQYATMIYLVVDPSMGHVAWCSAGGPPPMVVSTDRRIELEATGLPLGIKADAVYRSHTLRLPEAGILSVFSDGLYESGGDMPDVPQEVILTALAESAGQASAGQLTEAAQGASHRLGLLRKSYPCADHFDDVMAICVAFATPSRGRDLM